MHFWYVQLYSICRPVHYKHIIIIKWWGFKASDLTLIEPWIKNKHAYRFWAMMPASMFFFLSALPVRYWRVNTRGRACTRCLTWAREPRENHYPKSLWNYHIKCVAINFQTIHCYCYIFKIKLHKTHTVLPEDL